MVLPSRVEHTEACRFKGDLRGDWPTDLSWVLGDTGLFPEISVGILKQKAKLLLLIAHHIILSIHRSIKINRSNYKIFSVISTICYKENVKFYIKISTQSSEIVQRTKTWGSATFNKWQTIRGRERRGGGKENRGYGNSNWEGIDKEMGGLWNVLSSLEESVFL